MINGREGLEELSFWSCKAQLPWMMWYKHGFIPPSQYLHT